jgi:NTE family protein
LKSPQSSTGSGVRLFVAFMFFLFLITACAHYPVNPKLDVADSLLKEKASMISGSPEGSGEFYFVLAFSGGGTRAAALSYGILEALNRVKIPPIGAAAPSSGDAASRTLLQEVDAISSVSGGSFTAAYYGLYGNRIFEDYKERFLTRNVQRGLFVRVFLNPINWFRLGSSKFGKSDLASEYYDKLLFDGATIGDIIQRGGPVIRIQATDMSGGFPFDFTAPTFTSICSDLYRYPVSRAVAASAAFPGPFTPIVLKNYAGQCGFEEPAWVQQALEIRDTSSREYHTAKRMSAYFDLETKQYVQLIDGGVADNLGVRGPTEVIGVMGGKKGLEKMASKQPRHLAIIVVNASTPEKYKWSHVGKLPGLKDVISRTSNIMLQSYNFETMYLLRETLKELGRGPTGSGKAHPPIKTYLIEVGFNALPNRDERMEFSEVPTSFYLPEDTVDKIRNAAGRILFSLPEFKRLVRELGGELPDKS